MVNDDNLKGEYAFIRFTMFQSVVFTCDIHFEPFYLCQLCEHYKEPQFINVGQYCLVILRVSFETTS
jgi:hypothetical protein